MNLLKNDHAQRKLALLALLISVPAFAVAQHKGGGGGAPHPSAPAHASAPVQHAPAPHNTGSMGRPANQGGHPGNTMGNRPGGTVGNHSTNTMGNRPGSTMGNRPGTSPAAKCGRCGPASNNTVGNRTGNTMGSSQTGGGGTGKTGGSGSARPAYQTGGSHGMGDSGRTVNNNAKTGANTMSRPVGANAGHPGNGTAGHTAMNRTPPGRQVALHGGGTAHIRPNGQIRSVSRNGMQIQHGVHGGRTVVSTHNGARVVTTGAHGGYVQRNYVVRNGNTYVSRTYVVNNVSYTNVYRSYGYGGYCCYYGYAPAYYWHPVYYGWAYNPWPAPVYYGWGWGGAPWYGYYGAYYAPYPVYPAAYFWLTDWMLAASLRAAYEAQAEENGALSPLVPDLELVAGLGPIPVPDDAKVQMSKEAKDALAEEVKAQLAEEKEEASSKSGSSAASSGGGKASGPPPALDPKRRTFVVNDEVSTMADGDECSLTAGDVISRVSDTPDSDRNVDVKILASKKADCAVGKQVSVAVDDLQEMHNHFREQIASGMDELSKKQGTGGLPKAPDTGKQDGEVPAPAPDSSAAKTLKDQQAAADQTEADVKKEAGSSSGGAQ